MANEIDIGQLTESQQEALQMYTSITDDDPITAIPLLQRSAWNVQIAVTKRFDGEQPDPLAEAQAAADNAPPAQSSRILQNLQQESFRQSASPRTRPETVSRITPQSTAQTTYRAPFLLSLFFLPFNLAYRIFSTGLSYFPFLQRIFSRLLSSTASTRPTTSSSSSTRRPLPPSDAATRFIREFNEEYGPSSHSLPFTESSFNACLDTAKSSLKYLLVLLISPEHDDTPSWVRSTLLTAQFSSFLTSHSPSLILWGGTLLDPEPYSLADQLRVTKFPFAALIAHDPAAGSNAMCTIARCVGPLSASDLVAKLAAAMTAHDDKLANVRLQRQEQTAQRNLRAEQESAYERSLAQDREKTRKRKEEEARKAQEEKEAAELVRKAEQEKENLTRWKRWRAGRLPSEPSTEAKDAIRISIRMPETGERVIRKFGARDAVEDVYAFVECYEVLKERVAVEDEKGAEQKPEGFTHKYPFRLVSPMPRTVYDLEQGGDVGERFGKGANLIVESVEDEDEDDE
ncbi:MAG: hypothetical protein Q9160_002657 [Pyrenula sp. 1 TL-2023]